MRLDATIAGISTANSLLPLNVGFNAVWADANAVGLLYRIDPATNRVTATIPVGDPDRATPYGGTTVAIGEGSVWTADSSPTVTRVNPKTNAVVAVRGVGSASPEFVAAGYGWVWVNDMRFSARDWAH